MREWGMDFSVSEAEAVYKNTGVCMVVNDGKYIEFEKEIKE